MLNRNHQTLSALSNRLNLGTRSLVLSTGVNGGTALRIRADYSVSMRVFMAMPLAPSISPEGRSASPITPPASAAWACWKACDKASKPGDADASRALSPSWPSWRHRHASHWESGEARQSAARAAA